jgi:allantoinase
VMSQRDRLWVARPGELARYVETLPAGVVPGDER